MKKKLYSLKLLGESHHWHTKRTQSFESQLDLILERRPSIAIAFSHWRLSPHRLSSRPRPRGFRLLVGASAAEEQFQLQGRISQGHDAG